MPQACANGILAYNAINSVPMVAAQNRRDVNSIPNIAKTFCESGHLIRIDEDNISHCEESRKAGNDLGLYGRTVFGNFKKLVHIV